MVGLERARHEAQGLPKKCSAAVETLSLAHDHDYQLSTNNLDSRSSGLVILSAEWVTACGVPPIFQAGLAVSHILPNVLHQKRKLLRKAQQLDSMARYYLLSGQPDPELWTRTKNQLLPPDRGS